MTAQTSHRSPRYAWMSYTCDSFTWREDDHTLEARCVFCAERIVWTHHAGVTQILADVAEHNIRCVGQ